MKPITHEILTKLFQNEKAWRWKGRGAKKHIVGRKDDWIKNQYEKAHEYLWVERVYLKKQFRAYHLFKVIALGIVGEDSEYARTHFGQCWMDNKELVDTIECDNCLEELQLVLSDSRYTYPQPCFVEWWFDQHPEWEMEEITNEMLDEINIKPGIVHQPVLF